jgi:hemerythrin-like domain-containing protein
VKWALPEEAPRSLAWRATSGKEKTMQGRSPFEELLQEHMALLTDVGDLQTSIRGLAQPESAALGGGVGPIRDSLDIFQRRLRIHFRREEEGVFPDAQRMVSEGARGADVFGRFFAEEAEDDMSAHATLTQRASEMMAMVAQMEQAGGPDEASARRLLALVNLTANLIQRHAGKEDTLIFPMIEKSLTAEQVAAVSERLKKLASDKDLLSAEESGLTKLDRPEE